MRFWLVAWIGVACSTPAREPDPLPGVVTETPPIESPGSAGARSGAQRRAEFIDTPPPPPPVGAAVAAPLDIVDAPIKWSDKRAALTLSYRQQHSDPAATDLVIAPRMIILHYTAGGSAKGTRDYMDNLELETSRTDLARGGKVNVSAHYLVDRDGTIYKLQSETRFARHCIGLNHIAIGIENVGDDKKWPLTDAQVAADAALVRKLAHEFPITHLLGHYEAMKFRKHAYFVERDPTYANDKPDPGAPFMRRVRERVADLKLSGL